MKNNLNKKQIFTVYKPLCMGLLLCPTVLMAQNNDTISYSKSLDEVVVQTAYGSARKSTITGSISQVERKDIEKRPVSTVTAALEGSVSGVTVNNTFGQPGTAPSITVRGIGTVNGTYAPLYVLDGAPYMGNIADLNPNDIESVTVLKDAASCALYGNRASNGVILITSKKGNSNKMSFNLKANFGTYSKGMKEYKTLNPKQYMEVSWLDYRNNLVTNSKMSVADASQYATENLVNKVLKINIFDKPGNQLFDSNGKLVADANILDGYKDDLDWYDQATRHGFRQEYNFSGNQMGAKSDSYFSLGYVNEDGYLKNSAFERLNGRLAMNYRPYSWFNTGFSMMGSHQKSNIAEGTASESNRYTNAFFFCRTIAPVYPVHKHNADGSYLLDSNGDVQFDTGDNESRNQYLDRNIIYENQQNSNKTVRNSIYGSAYATLKFLDDFSFTVKLDGNEADHEKRNYFNAVVGDGKGLNGMMQSYKYRTKNYTFQQQLNWGRHFGEHSVSVLLGHENFSYSYDYDYLYKTNQTFAGKDNASNFSTVAGSTGYSIDYRTESYLGRVRYNYLNRYNVEASFRRDGSSRFSKQSRWGNFGSIGANWIISNEEFMKNVDWVDNLKLRADFGQVGNDAAADYYAYMALYAASVNAGEGAYYQDQLENLDLKWETGQSFGIALDARMFNRWNLSVEYFDKRNKDLLFDVYLPLSAGGNDYKHASAVATRNIGTMSNRGVEINTDVDIYRTRDWTVNFAANATYIKNKVVKLPEQNKNGILSDYFNIVEGKSLYEYYLYTFVGVDQMTGNSLYKADLSKYCVKNADNVVVAGNANGADLSKVVTQINGEYYVNNPSYSYREFQGSAIPKFYGSFSPSVRYKSFAVSALFTYSIGGKVFDNVYKTLMTTSGTPQNNHVDILKSWQGVPDGMTADSPDRIAPHGIPQVNSGLSANNNAVSSRWLVDASYIVLKNLYASYDLPKAWSNVAGLQNVRVSLSCENLFTNTKRQGMNPQQSSNGFQYNCLVTPRVFTLGVDVKF